jgi:metal-responsive CopG/Arc/MetJ family transcriptional regulator
LVAKNRDVKISISLPNELVSYIDARIDNRSQLIESLLCEWQKEREREAMVIACLALDEITQPEEDEWQQAAITDWEVSG